MGKWIDEINNPQYWSEEPKYCINCTCYINYQDGTGWCTTFERKTKDYHSMTNDCRLNGAIVLAEDKENNPPASEYQPGNKIKLIEPEIHHTQWQEYQVEEVRQNENLYRDTDTYLSQSLWYYRVKTKHSQSIWLAENAICLAEQSNLICTEEIF
jgi:hypothetical protein